MVRHRYRCLSKKHCAHLLLCGGLRLRLRLRLCLCLRLRLLLRGHLLCL